MINKQKNIQLAVIGLGYVGLPLALEFGKKREVIGFDINKKRIEELNSGIDSNKESTIEDLQNIKKLSFTNHEKDLSYSNTY